MSRDGLEPGTVVGDWALEERLGEGGFGEVWRARRLPGASDATPEHVAIKLARDPRRVADLDREAGILRRLDHEGIVRIHRVDATARPPFIAMELIAGGDLGRVLDGRRLAFRDAAEVAEQAARALAAAHDAGVVHGDLKPANVLVDGELDGIAATDQPRRVVLADFGLGRGAEGEAEASLEASLDGLSIDAAQSIRGTLAYLAPEVKRGAKASPASDVYAVGLLLYQMLVGRLPHGAWRSPGRLGVVGPRELDRVLARILDPDPARRPSAAAVASDLRWLGTIERALYDVAPRDERACPIDGTPLVHQAFGEVELDRCRSCGGTWFDREELDEVVRALVGDAAANAGREVDPDDILVAIGAAEDGKHSRCVVCNWPMKRARIRLGLAGGSASELTGAALRCKACGQWIPSDTRLEIVGAAHALGRATDEAKAISTTPSPPRRSRRSRRPEVAFQVEPPPPQRTSKRAIRNGLDRDDRHASPVAQLAVAGFFLLFLPCCCPLGMTWIEQSPPPPRLPEHSRLARRIDALARAVLGIAVARAQTGDPEASPDRRWARSMVGKTIDEDRVERTELRGLVRDHALVLVRDIPAEALDDALDSVFR